MATTQDVLEEGQDKRRVYASLSFCLEFNSSKPLSLSGAYAAIAAFLLFSIIQFRDGPFIRPHPVFWRLILGVNLLYELALVFLLFQDLKTARHMMTYIDSNLGVPIFEKDYAKDCTLTLKTFWVWSIPSVIVKWININETLGHYRCLLLSAYFRLVWEGHDIAWLLVLLGPSFLYPICSQLINSIQ